ncbi:UDP-N-acetylmuramate--L-alanine ligase [Candidatus Fermentibacteria bacterium]|nr:MAG: UDP-N-acetylmuramate--L-alanine ligase [Candidatus Fermentibacteria bacterium]
MRVHLIGICGAGMSALAAWYKALGAEVTGCDGSPSPEKEASLAELGIAVQKGHSPEHLKGVDRVVFTAALPPDTSELNAAAETGIPVLRRSEALAELCSSHSVVAIAGAHGKTTTTSMAGWIAQECGLDPTVFVGGNVNCWNGNFRPGGNLAIVESDEYDRTFLRLTPAHAAVTSYALEHLECYGSPEALEWAFQAFLESVLPGGTVIVPVEKPGLGYWAKRIGRKVLRSGSGGEIDAKLGEYSGWGEKYTLLGHRGFLPAPGAHNVRNAQVAVALCRAFGVEPGDAVAALESWPGVSRRLEKLGEFRDTVFVSDYAHHPDEMAAALGSLRKFVDGPVTVVFQPHLYSRTSLLHREMGVALKIATKSYVLPIYPARELPVPGVDSSLVVQSARKTGADCSPIEPEDLMQAVENLTGGVLIFMGAGSVDRYARELCSNL